MLMALVGWAWGGVGPWIGFLWWQAIAPCLQCALNCFGLVWLGERAALWWRGE